MSINRIPRSQTRMLRWLPLIWLALALQWFAPMASADSSELSVRLCSVLGEIQATLDSNAEQPPVLCVDCLVHAQLLWMQEDPSLFIPVLDRSESHCIDLENHLFWHQTDPARWTRAPPQTDFS